MKAEATSFCLVSAYSILPRKRVPLRVILSTFTLLIYKLYIMRLYSVSLVERGTILSLVYKAALPVFVCVGFMVG